jgi:hypothetical protein
VILRLLGAPPGDQFRVSFCETVIASDDHPKSQIGPPDDLGTATAAGRLDSLGRSGVTRS